MNSTTTTLPLRSWRFICVSSAFMLLSWRLNYALPIICQHSKHFITRFPRFLLNATPSKQTGELHWRLLSPSLLLQNAVTITPASSRTPSRSPCWDWAAWRTRQALWSQWFMIARLIIATGIMILNILFEGWWSIDAELRRLDVDLHRSGFKAQHQRSSVTLIVVRSQLHRPKRRGSMSVKLPASCQLPFAYSIGNWQMAANFTV